MIAGIRIETVRGDNLTLFGRTTYNKENETYYCNGYSYPSEIVKEVIYSNSPQGRLTFKYPQGTTNYLKYNNDCICDYKYQQGIDRLAEYEDIGTVDDFKDLKAGAENLNLKGDEILLKPFEVKGFVYDSEEYKQLKAENERLTKLLENSMQLPCKVGDTVYYIRAAISKNPREPKIEVGTVLKIIVTKSGLRLALSMNSVYENSTNSIGKAIFFDEQEANNVLENLKQRMK